MKKQLRKVSLGVAAALGMALSSSLAWAATELNMYYPVAVGGPLTKVVDGMVSDFMAENPDIKVRRALSIVEHLKRENGVLDFKKLNEVIKEFNQREKLF